MSIYQFLAILRARRMVLFATLLTTVAAVVAISLLMPNKYKATATLVLNYKGVDPLNGVVIPAQLMPGYMATQTSVVSSVGVAAKVVEAIGLDRSEAQRSAFAKESNGKGDLREWIAARLLKSVKVEAARDSSVLSIHVKAEDPAFAATVANTFAQKYQETSADLRSGPMKTLSIHLKEESEQLRRVLQAAQIKRAAFQREKGIVNLDERLDVETTRLNELSRELVATQSQAARAKSESSQVRSGHGEQAPEVAANPLIQRLQEAVAQAEANFVKVAGRYMEDHPAYRSAQEEVRKAQAILKAQVARASATVGNSAHVAEQRQEELQKALDAQKKKILDLNVVRADLASLDSDVYTAQKAFDNVSARLQQTQMEATSGQTDIGVLGEAVPPIKPDSPKLLLNALLAVALGGVLGIGLSLLLEIFDRRIRSARDLKMLDFPVLACVSCGLPRPTMLTNAAP